MSPTSPRDAFARRPSTSCATRPQGAAGGPARGAAGTPVASVRNFIAVGLDYEDHAKETGCRSRRSRSSSQAAELHRGPNDYEMVPKGSLKLDYRSRRPSCWAGAALRGGEGRALLHRGYTICNDVSEPASRPSAAGNGWRAVRRDLRAAGAVARHDPRDPRRAGPAMSLDVNGQGRETGSTRTMIFSSRTSSHLSQFMVLEAGDVVTTGTPPGVALDMKPPVWLKPGHAMTLRIEGLASRPRRSCRSRSRSAPVIPAGAMASGTRASARAGTLGGSTRPMRSG